MHVHIVRHGQTSWNVEMRAQGHRDIPLDEEGERQAIRLVRSFEDVRIDRIVSSDLSRAMQTADPVAKWMGLGVELRADLRERSFGTWEGIQFSKFIPQMTPAERENYNDAANFRPPNGESFVDVWERLDGFVSDLATEYRDVLVVTHGGTGSVLVAKLIQAGVASARSFRFGNTGITTLARRSDGHYVIMRYNDTTHLRSLDGSESPSLVEAGK